MARRRELSSRISLFDLAGKFETATVNRVGKPVGGERGGFKFADAVNFHSVPSLWLNVIKVIPKGHK